MTCFSQSYELGKVTLAELEEKEHPVEKDAEAAVLFDIGRTFFEFDINKGFKLVTEVTTKIKVYKKEGYSFADISVPIYVGDSEIERVSFSKAITYNLVNGKIEKTKMKSDGEFTEKVNKYWSVVKISLPNVREGSIIEYKYELTSPFLSNLPEWYFQKSIPEVLVRRFRGRISENFFYNTLWYYLFCVLYKIFKNRKRKIVVLIFLVLIPVLTIIPYLPMIISSKSSLELLIVECNFYLFLSF